MANAVPNLRSQLILSLLCGLTWAVLMHIRAVTLYLIVPLALLMLLRTKRWQPPLLLLVAFMISSGFISYTTGLLLGQNETPASSNIMMLRIAENHGDWFEPGNGENTRVFLATQATCPGHPFFIYWCLTQEYGSFQEAANVVRGATFETLSLHPEAYLREVIRLFGDYLSLAVPQYGIDPSTPNAAQCQQRNSQPEHPYDLPSMHWTWALPDITDDTNARVRAMTLDAAASFCPPPYAESPQAKALVDSWASRYRSLGRPNAVVWYAALLLTTLAVPWARRCLTPILLLTGVLAYFALIHAILVSVEPRYVVVTNPIRAILLTFLAYFGAKLLAKGAAAVWQRSR